MPAIGQSFASFVERAGKRIPDPVIIFMAFYPAAYLLTVLMSGYSFETVGAGGDPVQHQILGMHKAEHMRWLFDNALVANWLAFGNGVLGVILVVMLAVGIAEHSGLFGALIKRRGAYSAEPAALTAGIDRNSELGSHG